MSFTPGLQLPYGITPVNPVPVDGYSGPYATTTEALANIPQAIRFPTMQVRIVNGDDNQMYWFKDGVLDADLIEFSPTNANLLTFVAHLQNTSWLVNEAADFNSGNNANPTIYVFRGNIYKFKVASSIGHTLQIRSANGTAYSIGMPTSGAGTNTQGSGGYILWTVPYDAPDDLFYVCTAHQSVMKGHIRVIPSLVAPITPSAEQGNANQVAYTSNTGSYSLASNSAITKAIHIDSTVCISINGVRRLLTDSNTSPFFFSRTGGSTQLLLAQVQAGDSLYVRPAYLEHGLETTDLILLEYFSGGTVTLASPTPSATYYWNNVVSGGITPGTYVPGYSVPLSRHLFTFSETPRDVSGNLLSSIGTTLANLQPGSTITGFEKTQPLVNYGTWTVHSVQSYGTEVWVYVTSNSGLTGTNTTSTTWGFTFTP